MAEEKKKALKKKTEKAEAGKKPVKKKLVEKKPVEKPETAKAQENEMPKIEEKKPEIEHHKVHHPKPKIKKPIVAVPYGTGRRKTATAKVWLSNGTGKITLNGQPAEEYFVKRERSIKSYLLPFSITNTLGKYDVKSYVLGGGVAAQADALRMAIARALAVADPGLRQVLRTNDVLSRDPREKERKKYGLKRARRAFQYTKR